MVLAAVVVELGFWRVSVAGALLAVGLVAVGAFAVAKRYGDYLDLVETGTELLAGLRDSFASTLNKETAEEYEAEFNHAVLRRLPRFALEIENL